MNKRNKLLAMNSLTALMLQIVNLICGLILPRLILSTYGSDVNGMVSSITQFLSLIALLDGGLGGVIRAAYYKPFAEGDADKISAVYNASNKFYRQLTMVFLVYICVLAASFPLLSKNDYDYWFTFSLVVIISLATIMQYFWGQTQKLLVFSNQKGYVQIFTQILTIILNTIISAALIKCGASIHLVKFGAAIAYIIQPLILGLYIKKNYKINKMIKPDEAAIGQRWSALGQHIAFYIHSNTDIAILTLFTSLKEVSVYAVHKIVVNGLTSLVSGVIGNTEATFGDLLARGEKDQFIKEFKTIDMMSKILSTVIFSTGVVLITQFVQIYVKGVQDVNYYRPAFSVIFCMSEWIYCIGLNYNNVIVSVGHFRQTTKYSIIEAVINIILSLVLVSKMGIEGVVLATLIAMAYKMIVNVIYINKNIIYIDIIYTIRSLVASSLAAMLSFVLFKWIYTISVNNYLTFFASAFFIVIVISVINLLVFALLCHNEFKIMAFKFKKILNKAKAKKH